MDLFTKILIPLTVCLLVCVHFSATASLSAYLAGRQKRSDDTDPLGPVVSQLAAKLTAAEAKINAMQADLTMLKAKHCQTGAKVFRPHDKTETINGVYHERRHTSHVTFSHPFSTTPWVAISLTGVDEDSNTNFRVAAGVSSVTGAGFDAFVYEWADTHLYSVTVTWMACNV